MIRNLRVGTLPWNCATLVWQHRRQLYAILVVWAVVYAGVLLLVINGKAALLSALLNLSSGVDTMAEFRLVDLVSDTLGEIGLVILESVLVVLLLRQLIGRDRVPPDRSGFLRAFWPIAALSLAIELSFANAYQTVRLGGFVADNEAREAVQALSAIALGAAYVWLYARFCLVFPYAAMGEGWKGRMSWRQTSAFWFRLSAMLAVVFFADVLISTAIWQWASAAVAAIIPHADWLRNVVGVIMISVKNTVTMTIFLGIVVVAFGRVSGRWVTGVRGGPRSPDDMAGVFD